MGLSVPHILLVLLAAVLLFGRGKISDLMGDVAKGIKSFKKGMTEEDEVATPAEGPKKLEGKAPESQPMSSTTSGSPTSTKVG